ncbi:hypothetical protein G4B88_030196 [Cannabis sativa]|uniref:Uncharacterized protein n=1 Tax=Cannabis sativa TaxID=3483 RepID=A0A7J6EZ28_CANSA|nr:hypothetical protein G4B88_030196 [Cannabis sativa]
MKPAYQTVPRGVWYSGFLTQEWEYLVQSVFGGFHFTVGFPYLYTEGKLTSPKTFIILKLTDLGPTMLSTTVHAMSILLEISKWDWFINLNASDYPLVSQGGMQWKRKNERESRGEDMMQAMLNPFS